MQLMPKPRIPYTKPSITDLEIRYATDAVTNGWGERCYEWIVRFEESFKSHLGVKHAIATSSCTGALHMGLSAIGIKPGDEVILADTNWIATVAPVVHLGAKPVLVDILHDSWCLDPVLVEAAITPRTKAIIAVHIYGNLCAMDRLLSISNRYGIPLIEDAAEAIGSVWHGRRAGTMGLFGTFSFHGTKTLTTGEGGIFVTNDDSLYEQVLTLSNHGRSRGQSKQFWADTVGFKYKMSNVQAAIGCAQLERIEELVSRKRQIMQAYREAFANNRRITMNPEPHGTKNGSWMPTIVFDSSSGVTRELLLDRFKAESIDARVFFWPLSSLPMFGGQPINPIAADVAKRAINLPSYHDCTDEIQSRISQIIDEIGTQARTN